MRKGKGSGSGSGGGGGRNGLFPHSLRIISSCLKTVSANAGSVASTVRSAGASVAASIAVPAEEEKDQVLWAGFDKLELGPSSFKHVLLLGYSNGFQVLDVEDASSVCELVSKRDGPVTFLQMQPTPAKSDSSEGFKASHPLLLVVAGDETKGMGTVQGGRLSALIKETTKEPQPGNCFSTPTVVRFYSLKSHSYVHVLRFRSAVYMVRCSPRIVAIALAAQIYCFDALTLENKFSVLTYPLQGAAGFNIGYGPMAVGPRWLAYAPNNPLLSNTARLSPQNLTPSPGVSPSTSPGNGSLVARYAMESSKHLAAGILNLGSSRKVGRLPPSAHLSEADNAGMVVVKDFVSKEVISQFRAHTSPISALCFDPSGTLLVTASVHGHNINVFRIMPRPMPNSSNPVCYDWANSHVHLYKLYRGITAAVIQDICFSPSSQWIAIVSSRGTCHIFVLSPFGGDAILLPQSLNCDGPILVPNFTSPWWSTSSYNTEQQFLLPPPPPITLSVVSRIKNGNSGWLNTVSNVAASAAGKVLVPSGAIAAVFHNSIYRDNLPAHLKANSLENLLVYSPSGHLVQHVLVPSLGAESCDDSSGTGASPLLQLQDDELHVNAEPVQWWDVCRKMNWPEREESISNIVLDKQHNTNMAIYPSDFEDNDAIFSVSPTGIPVCKECTKSCARPHWYLSNAEVQINSCRIPIWQKPKICFYVMTPRASCEPTDEPTDGFTGEELEIEGLPNHEVEIRRKNLIPVFEQFQGVQSDWNDRNLTGGRCWNSSTETILSLTDNRMMKNDAGIMDSRPASLASGPYIGPCKPRSLHPETAQSPSLMACCGREDGVGLMTPGTQLTASTTAPEICCDKNCSPIHYEHYCSDSPTDSSLINSFSNSGSSSSPVVRLPNKESQSSSSEITEQVGTVDSFNSMEFTQYLHEGYCKISELNDCCELTEAATDVDSSSSHCEREKPEEDGDNDEMLGGVFAFCEEG
ncbi:WD40 repeat protein [Dioscorea alata]|uniref:WD40 repeat protein n=5 Tax=Dioscorea alata TaxID=55571 RepID=A0ACB7V0W9_DIOAL|nr:WD40 repeat protein [Dioscorea alata]